MSLNLQQLLMTLMTEINSGLGFLNVSIIQDTTGSIIPDYALAKTLAYIFISSDLLLYAGIVAVIAVLGAYYRKTNIDILAGVLLKVSAAFLYLSVVFNLFGLILGFDFLASSTVTLFEGSYTFSMFSQVLKIFMFLILGGIYALFPPVILSKMRVLELPVLLQICSALCSTIISSSNFALLLLALEGFSLTLYVMTALGRSYGGVTASVKYFAFGTLGSVFLF